MMASPLSARRIVLGVTGSIAAYKAADLASRLAQAGAQVDAVLTAAATRFIAPLTFQSVTGRQAYVDEDLWGSQAHILHVGLARGADLLAIAPATAEILARLVSGQANDLLGLTALAATCPLLVAPAMDAGMFEHPATQANLAVLRDRGAVVVGPEVGHLASGLVARGRMTEPADIVGHIRFRLSRGGPLRGRTIVVTAGGTQEPIDPVRVLTNRSSGRQGFALAQASLDAGADVTLVAAPAPLPTPMGATRINVRTVAEMDEAVRAACRAADALLMAAAVSDFRPAQQAPQKIKKAQGLPALTLEPTVDILSGVARLRDSSGFPRVLVGFAAETEGLLENAAAKLRAKHLNMIVANDVGGTDAGFEVDTNRVTLIDANGVVEALPLLSKAEVAERIIEKVVIWLADRRQR